MAFKKSKIKRVTITIPETLHEQSKEWCDEHYTAFSSEITAMWLRKLNGGK